MRDAGNATWVAVNREESGNFTAVVTVRVEANVIGLGRVTTSYVTVPVSDTD